jgi:type I restriction enzyme S subunit
MSIPAGWEQTTVGEVVDFQGGTQPPKSEFVYEAKPGYVRLVQIRDFRSDEYKTYIPSSLARNSFGRDDVMIGRYGPPVFQIFRGLEGAYNVALIKAMPNLSKMSKDFLYLVLQQESLFNLIDGLSRRSAGQAGVDMDALRSFPLLLPPPPIQDFIARRVNLVNQGIGQLTDLISVKLRFKQEIMQQLLTGGLRFPEFVDEWLPTLIGDLLVESRVAGSSGATAKKITIKLYGKGVIAKFDQRPGSASTKYYRRSCGQFIYSKLDFLNGAFGIVPDELDGFESTLDLPAFDFTGDVDPAWFLYFVVREQFYKHHLGLANGGRKARRVNPSDLLKISIPLPSLSEQRTIADFLKAMDREIELLRKQLDLLKLQKKGLMQKLLTGQVRVKLPKGTK